MRKRPLVLTQGGKGQKPETGCESSSRACVDWGGGRRGEVRGGEKGGRGGWGVGVFACIA